MFTCFGVQHVRHEELPHMIRSSTIAADVVEVCQDTRIYLITG